MMNTQNGIDSNSIAPVPEGDGSTHERVAKKAYLFFLERGAAPGGEMEDWLKAEQMVKEEMEKEQRAFRRATEAAGLPAIRSSHSLMLLPAR